MLELTQHRTCLSDPVRLEHQGRPLPLGSQDILLSPLAQPIPGPSVPWGLQPKPFLHITLHSAAWLLPSQRPPVPSAAQPQTPKTTATAPPQPWAPHFVCPRVWLPQWLRGKESACNAGDVGLILGSGRSPGEGYSNPLQYSCLENPMDRGAWGASL